jgi:hypothetical protein
MAILAILPACNPKRANETGQRAEVTFVDSTTVSFAATKDRFGTFLSALPAIQTPLELHCGLHEEYPDTFRRDADPQMKDFYPRDLVIGRLWSNRHFVALLYGSIGDWIDPSILTYSPTGKLIDSLDIRVYCEGEPGYSGISFTIIASNQTVTAIDTVSTAVLDSLQHEIAGTDSTFLVIRTFQIDSLGQVTIVRDSKSLLRP